MRTLIKVAILTTCSYFVTGFRPNATQHTAHHMLIYGCPSPGSDQAVWNCGEMHAPADSALGSAPPCSGGSQIIYAWAKDAPRLDLPEGVGFRVGKDSDIKYLVLQVHYAALDQIPESGDDSGIFLDFTTEEQPKVAGVLLMGTAGMAPPHSTTYFETACEIEDPRQIHPFAFRTHTHKLGKVVSGFRVRDRSQWDLIGKRDPQKPQMFYPVNDDQMVMTKGDIIAARCTMVNHLDRPVYVGATNDDEMCNYYIMYWVDGGKPISPSTCFTEGPPMWSWGGWELGAALKVT